MQNVKFGYLLSSAEYVFSDLLKHTVMCEKAGMDSVHCADHFLNYFHSGAQNPHAWVIITALAENTSKLSLGSLITAPVEHYHPADVAQAFGTLDFLYPGRISLTLGAGTSCASIPRWDRSWPMPEERVEILREAAEIIKGLFNAKDYFSHKGKYWSMGSSFLYTKSATGPPIGWASSGRKSTEYAGRYADYWATTYWASAFPEEYKVLLARLRRGAEKVGKDFERMEKWIMIPGSFAGTEEEALKSIISKPSGRASPNVPIFQESNLSPKSIEELTKAVTAEDVRESGLLFTSADDIIERYESLIELGFTRLIWSDMGDTEESMKIFKEKIIPYFKERKS